MRICMDTKTYVDDEQFLPLIRHKLVFNGVKGSGII